MRSATFWVLTFALAAALAPAQHDLVLHIRYNPFQPPSPDTVHMLLLPRAATYTPAFIHASNPVVTASVAVDSTIVNGEVQSNPTVLRDALINAVNTSGTGYTAVANLPDVLTISGPAPLQLAVRTDNDLVGPTPTSALLVAFGNGVGAVADGVLNNTAPCINQSDQLPFPYTGAGYCFIEHASTILYGEGNGRDLVIESAVGAAAFDQTDKVLSIGMADSFTIRVFSPLGSLDSADLFVIACLTDRYVSHFIPVQPELDVLGFHNASILAVGVDQGVLPGDPLVGDAWQVTVSLSPTMTALAGLTVVYQALCPDPGSANGLIAITQNIRHDLVP